MTWCGYHGLQFTARNCTIMPGRWRPTICLAKDLLGGTSDLLRLLAWTNHIKFNRWELVRITGLALTVRRCNMMRCRWRPTMRLATDLLCGTSELLRLLARTNHSKLNRWNSVRVQCLAVHWSHFHNYVLKMEPDHASAKDLMRGNVGFAPTSGLDHSP